MGYPSKTTSTSTGNQQTASNLPTQIAYTTNIQLDGNKYSVQTPVTGPEVITKSAGAVAGGSYFVERIANGVNIPSLPSAWVNIHPGSDFVNQAGNVNLLSVFETGSNTTYSWTDLGGGTAAVTLSALTLSENTFTEGAAAGTVIGAIQNTTSGSSLSVTPSDTLAIDGQNNLIVGLTAASVGDISATITETLAGATNTPNTTSLTVTVEAASQAIAPVAHFHFDEDASSPNFTDSSATGLVETKSGSVITTTDGKFGNAMQTTGTADRFEIGGATVMALGTRDFTLASWIKVTDFTEGAIDLFSGRTYAIRLIFDGLLTGLGATYNVGALPEGQYVHIAICREAGVDYVFFDGVLVATGPNTTDYASASRLGFSMPSVVAANTVIKTDEAVVIDGTALYTSNFTPPTAPYSFSSAGGSEGGEPSAEPILTVSSTRQLGDYTGPIMQVQRLSDSAVLDVSSQAAAITFANGGDLQFNGHYNQEDGAFLPTGNDDWEYSEVVAGIYGAKPKLSNATYPIAATYSDAFNGADGATFATVIGGGDVSVINPEIDLIDISTATNAVDTRVGMQLSGTGYLRLAARKTDSLSQETENVTYLPQYAMAAASYDADTAEAVLYNWGSKVRTSQISSTTGTTLDATNPLSAGFGSHFDGTNGQAIIEAKVYNTQASDADLLPYIDDVNTVYKGLHQLASGMNDGIYSWWNYPLMTEVSGKLYSGAVAISGAVYVSELDTATGKLQDIKVLTDKYPRDDHNAPVILKLHDNTLATMYTGHVTHLQANWRVSTDMSIATLGEENGVTATSALSYSQVFLRGTSDVDWFVREGVTWLWLRSSDNAQSFAYASAPIVEGDGGDGIGGTQIYCKLAKPNDTTIRSFSLMHPTNAQNELCIFDLDCVSGQVSSAGTNYGNALTDSSPCVNISQLTPIRTPAIGHSHRLLDVNADGTKVLIGDFETRDDVALGTTKGAGAVYIVGQFTGGDIFDAANWTWNEIASADAFWNSSVYLGGASFSVNQSGGLRVYVSRKDGAFWQIEQYDSVDGGVTWTSTLIDSNVQSLIRPISPVGATLGHELAYQQASYSSFLSFKSQIKFA